MRIAFSLLLAVHALIHVMGFVKAFELAPLAQLKLPISRPMGVLWLAATVLLVVAAALLFAAPRWFWLVGLVGLVASQVAIIGSWGDARFGTIANVVLLAVVISGASAWGPFGLRAEYEHFVHDALARTAGSARPQNITEADLAALPPPRPALPPLRGRRRDPQGPGLPRAHDGTHPRLGHGAVDALRRRAAQLLRPPRRYFWIEATRGGLPLDGLHAYGEADASMRIRLLSLLQVVHVSGPQMMRGETVTLLNDMCIFAPGSMLDPSIRWRQLDAGTVEATYTNGPHTVRAELVFDESGALIDFRSDDRPALAEDGKTLLPQRWSTPIRDHRAMGPYRLASRGEARYAAPGGEYTYIELRCTRCARSSCRAPTARGESAAGAQQPVNADLLIRRVQPDIRILGRQTTGAKAPHPPRREP